MKMNSGGGGGGGGKRSQSTSPLPVGWNSPLPGRQGKPAGADGTLGAKKRSGSISESGTTPPVPNFKKFKHPQPGMQGQPIGKDGTLGQAKRFGGMDNILALSAANRGVTLKFLYENEDEVTKATMYMSNIDFSKIGDYKDMAGVIKEIEKWSKAGATNEDFGTLEEDDEGMILMDVPTNLTEIASRLMYKPQFKVCVGYNLYKRRCEAHIADYIMGNIPKNLCAVEQLAYVKNINISTGNSLSKQESLSEQDGNWQEVLDDILEEEDVKELEPYVPQDKIGRGKLAGVFSSNWLYDRIHRNIKKWLVIPDIEEEEDMDELQVCLGDLEARTKVLEEHVQLNNNTTIYVATATRLSAHVKFHICPVQGDPMFIANDTNANKKQGFTIDIFFGSEELKSEFKAGILMTHKMSYQSFLRQYLAVDENSDEGKCKRKDIILSLKKLILLQILESDEMAIGIMRYLSADGGRDVVVKDEDVVLSSYDVDNIATNLYKKSLAEAAASERVKDAQGRHELVNGIMNDDALSGGRFLLQVSERFLVIPESKAKEFILKQLHNASLAYKRYEQMLECAKLAAEGMPDSGEIMGHKAVETFTDEGKQEIVRLIDGHIDDVPPLIGPEPSETEDEMDDFLSAYFGEGTMRPDGKIEGEEDINFLTKRYKIVDEKGRGLSAKNLAYSVEELTDERFLLVNPRVLLAALGGDASLLGERHGIKHIMGKDSVAHLNFMPNAGGNTDKVKGQVVWHLLYQTLLPNLRELLRKKKLFLFHKHSTDPTKEKNTKDRVNAKLKPEERNWLSWDPRIRHARVSTKTGKVKVYYTVPRL